MRNFAPKWFVMVSGFIAVISALLVRVIIIEFAGDHGGNNPLRLNIFCFGMFVVLFLVLVVYFRVLGQPVSRSIPKDATDLFIARIREKGMILFSEEPGSLVLLTPTRSSLTAPFASYFRVIILRREDSTDIVLSRLYNVTFWRFLGLNDFIRRHDKAAQ